MATDYPAELPADDLRTLFNIVTGREDRDLKIACKAGWVVQGYLQSLIVGDPTAVETLSVMSVPAMLVITDEQCVGLLASLAMHESGDVQVAGFGDRIGGLLKRQLAGMILPILQKWLTEFLESGGLERVVDRIIGTMGSPEHNPPIAAKE